MKSRSTKSAGFLLLSLMFVPLLCLSLAGAPSPSGTGAVSEIAAMHIARASHSSTLLPNGIVLIAGGFAGVAASTIRIAPRSCSIRSLGRFSLSRR